MGEDDGKHGREPGGGRLGFKETLPDAENVREQAQGHARVFGALVFEEEVEEGVVLVEFDAEKQVAFGARKLGVDEGAGFEFQRAPVECGGEVWGQMVLKEGACVFRGRKRGLEEFVVGLMNVVRRHEVRVEREGSQRTSKLRGRVDVGNKQGVRICVGRNGLYSMNFVVVPTWC